MNQMNQLLQSMKVQVQKNGLTDALELKPLFDRYSGQDWQQFLNKSLEETDSFVFHQSEAFKLLLIRWKPLKKSEKHGHPSGGGLVKILSGALQETRFDTLATDKVIGQYIHKKDDLAYIHDDVGYHIIENPFAETAYSLHVYTPGIYQSNIIKPNTEILLSPKGLKVAA